ncbi:MAG: bifunctional glycoside hydrolase 114/ polysaccharide deacetylase family protein [Agitococcus sp.]
MVKHLYRYFLMIVVCYLNLVLSTNTYATSPNVALFYGANPPLNELRTFDIVVVDPDHTNIEPQTYNSEYSQLFAYASVGEVHRSKAYFKQIPKNWLKSKNQAWDSYVLDQSSPEWPNFFAEQVIAPLWAKGYRGFFLDTLDSYQLISQTQQQRQAQEQGLINTIKTIKQRWPEAKLIFNRGFEILPQVHDAAFMVAAESLYQSWNAGANQYQTVKNEDRAWLINQLQQVKNNYQLPILVIDYVPNAERELARQTASKIRQESFIPWVTTGDLDSLGVGNLEVLPRKVLVIYNPNEAPDLHYHDAVRFLGAPLAYLGLVPEFISFNSQLPNKNLVGRYAGIISWINSDDIANNSTYPQWLSQQIKQGLPVAIFSRFGFSAETGLFNQLGLRSVDVNSNTPLQVKHTDKMMGFELPVVARAEELYGVQLQSATQPLLTLHNPQTQQNYHPAALTDWGGYVLAPYTVDVLPAKEGGERWLINPISFLTKALKLDEQRPIADVTTENGNRLLMVHIDGDGFMSIAERATRPFNGQVLLDDFFKRYQIPTTMSIIEGELGAEGLYPQQSPALEKIARDIYALPWIELASHSYSHPFFWSKAQQSADDTGDYESYHLPIKGYKYKVEREVAGSINYINQKLAPKNKQVKVFLWTGNCVATPEALAETVKTGVLNMNGGDTTITRSNNSWTRIAGLGLKKGNNFQVFAPNQNENVYTNLWTGPFYGFERVIETFELTDKPYRFKPINIYYHSYLVSKTAGANSLHKIYQWALKQPVLPIYSSEYIQKVLDFNDLAIARSPQGYRIRGNNQLKTLRFNHPQSIDFNRSPQLMGFNHHNQERYLHLANNNLDINIQDTPSTLAYIESANGQISQFQRHKNDITFNIKSYQPLRVSFANSQKCVLKANGKVLKTRQQNSRLLLEVDAHELSSLRLSCTP